MGDQLTFGPVVFRCASISRTYHSKLVGRLVRHTMIARWRIRVARWLTIGRFASLFCVSTFSSPISFPFVRHQCKINPTCVFQEVALAVDLAHHCL